LNTYVLLFKLKLRESVFVNSNKGYSVYIPNYYIIDYFVRFFFLDFTYFHPIFLSSMLCYREFSVN